jgi:hypothetical protein
LRRAGAVHGFVIEVAQRLVFVTRIVSSTRSALLNFKSNGARPTLAVSGLNPHAHVDHGFGRFGIEWLHNGDVVLRETAVVAKTLDEVLDRAKARAPQLAKRL